MGKEGNILITIEGGKIAYILYEDCLWYCIVKKIRQIVAEEL